MVPGKIMKTIPQQYGFRQGRNTIDPITTPTTDISNGFNERKSTASVFFDFEIAFNRHTIFTSLMSMRIHGRMLKFIHNYLNDRSIKVKIGNTLSDSHKTSAGVPQEGVLSATCFLVAINNILDTLPVRIKNLC